MTIKVGIHPQSLAGTLLLRADEFATTREALDSRVEWVRYGHGTETPARFAAGDIDIGLTGATPPITVQASGVDIVYLATGRPRPNGGAIVVPEDSPVRRAADLAGRRVGLAVGSWHTAFIALALAADGRSYRDITPVNFVDTAGRADPARVEAWIARPEEIDAPGLRVITRVGEVWSNQTVVFARRTALGQSAQSDQAISILLAALDRAGNWLKAHPAQAAQWLEEGSPVERSAIEGGIRRQPVDDGLIAVTSSFVQEQQRAADVLAEAGFIPQRVSIESALDPRVAAIWRGSELIRRERTQ